MPLLRPALDDIDRRLLDLLQIDADQTLRELGDQVGLTPSAVQRRIKRFKKAGLMRTVAVLDAQQTTGLTQALVMLTLAEESPTLHRRLANRLRKDPAVQQCYTLSGRWDYAVLVSAASVRELRDLSNRLFKSDDNIRRYDTMFVLDTVKAGTVIPVDLLG
ncbi:AsnC family transcriptional regulator [Epidermidibacterium keratini]|uniref:AsnC family transcriptional regulator n=2 Tax=Epidermidibacterium keratini TaxID=1891644 RepID=A0A7L4YI67_9ACTN|nr:AsnC family transcriptional regulator [Epidermidibacterium keratini]